MVITRRCLLRSAAGAGTGVLAGCSGGGTSQVEADVIAGPGGRLVFEPLEISVRPGATVTWFFESAGHNVSCRPEHSELVTLPEGAEPFASYGPNASPRQLVPAGETYAQTFSTEGVYRYVCIPHQGANMTGRVRVG